MDQLADAVASDQGNSTAEYADFLVQLARQQFATTPSLSLGINDGSSSLRRRVALLLQSSWRPRLTCPRAKSLAISGTTIALALLVAAIRLDANVEAPQQKGEAGTPAPDASRPAERPQDSELGATETSDGSIRYVGIVTDAVTGMPVAGANVRVIRKLSRDPETGGWRELETTEHQTDLLGLYTFVLPPEQVAEDSLYLEIEANHPKYAAKGRSGYSHAMIRKNLQMGELPFYTNIRLWPGEAITGRVVSPAGEPLADVPISMYSASDHSKDRFSRGSFDKTTTNSDGTFRIVPATPGDGVLWIMPEEFSPQAHRLEDRRGDWGTLTMEKGTTVTGQLLDAQGKPVGGVRVEARRRGDGEKADEFLNSSAVANQIGRKVDVEPDGKFTLASLPNGEYSLQVRSNSDSYDPPPLEQVFLRHNVTIEAGQETAPLTIRAVPHVVIQGTYLNSKGEPRSGHSVTMFGRMDGNFYAEESSTPGSDGKFEVKVPHGLQQVELDLHTNEHSSLRWRLSRGETLHRDRRVHLGTVEDDLIGLEVVRYTAPILLVKAVDEGGSPVKDWEPFSTYSRETEEAQMTMYTVGGHVHFETQSDGRWRSSQLLPDEPVSITVKKNGFTTTPQEVSLSEGTTKELVFVLVPDESGNENDAEPSSPTGTLIQE
jgi:hypothetical protein